MIARLHCEDGGQLVAEKRDLQPRRRYGIPFIQ